MDFIHFGRRMEIERLYLEWCEGEGIANKPNSFVVFLMSKGWLNERKIIEDLKDRKDEPNSSEKPNNCEKTDCDTCRYAGECDWEPWQECPYEPKTEPTISKMEQVDKDINVRSKDEPQTETEIAKAIVHKMIDDAVIAEDAYPDLRQKMHDAVDEHEPQTERRCE